MKKKLLHWNIHMWLTEDNKNNYCSIKSFIESVNPDFVTLTEVEEVYNKCLINKLAKELGYKMVYSPCFDFIYESIRYSFGNVVLSNIPFSSVEQKFITPVNFLYDGNEETEPRTLTLVELENINNFKIGITHLPRKEKKYRDLALENIKKFIPEKRFILSGDFNFERNVLLEHFSKFNIYPNEETLTYPCSNPKEGIDHVISSDIDIINCEIIENHSSDHFPLCIDFII